MNGSFENIFDKYNIRCKVAKKRRKSPKTVTQTLTLHKKDSSGLSKTRLICSSSPDSIRGINSNYTCHFNIKTKGKYYNPTRYKTLEVIGVQNVYESRYLIPSTENLDLTNANSKENVNLQAAGSSTIELNSKKNRPDDCTKTNITTSNLNNCKRYLSENININLKNKKQLNIPPIEANNSLSEPISAEKTITRILPTKPVENNCTELDLLIDLIEQEEKYKKVGHNWKNNLSCDDNLSCTKKCLKGGYQELFERTLKSEKVKSNFLKYDKKVGLRSGQLLSVVKIDTSYGLTLATVTNKDFNRNFVIAVSQEMAPRVKVGTRIETFFDDNTHAYKLPLNDKCTDIYLEPYKLLIV